MISKLKFPIIVLFKSILHQHYFIYNRNICRFILSKKMKHRLQKPVRCMLDRDEDMLITGTRHPFLFKYKVGFNDAGLIKVVRLYIYNNAGYSYDLSIPVSNNN